MTLNQRFGWRLFPVWLITALGFVIAVNVVFITVAEKTFPGESGEDAYDTGLKYNYVLDDEAREARLDWKIAASVVESHVTIKALDESGAAVGGEITASAVRPVGDATRVPLHFGRGEDGSFVAQETLAAGRWDVMMVINARQQVYRITKRIEVK
jgi:nitrogen fixation protein FixH